MRRIKIFARIISIVMALMLGTSALADEELVESFSTSSPEPVSVQIQETVNENVAPVVETAAEEKKSSIPDTVSKDSVSEIVNEEDTKSLVAQNSDLVEELIEEKQESIEENSVESETDYVTLPENIENSEDSIPEILPVLDKNNSTQNEASSSLYTVDFTNNGTTYSIAGDSKKVKLSTILNNINIAGDISDVKVFMDEDCTEDAENGLVAVDGKPLFNVYKDDDGEWYVDSTNAFSSVHGLKVLLPDNKEYRIKVTDAQTPIKYLDENGDEQTYTGSYTEIKNGFGSTSKVTTLNAGWYVVTGNNVDTKSLIVNGIVKIILTDNCKLKVSQKGYSASLQAEAGNSLIIYGQSTSNNMGKIEAYSNYEAAGIGGGSGKASGEITINGGSIYAESTLGGAAIGGGAMGSSGTIIINGGTINVKSKSNGAGIGGGAGQSSGSIIINGGTVTASSEQGGAGIGGGGAAYNSVSGTVYKGGDGTVTINGGTIVATGGESLSVSNNEFGAGAGIGGGGYVTTSSSYANEGKGTVVINNGDVTATAGQNNISGEVTKYAFGIGNGAKCSTEVGLSSITIVSKDIYAGESSTNNSKTSLYPTSLNAKVNQYVHILKTTLKPYVPPVSPIPGNGDNEENEGLKKVIVRSIEYSELSSKQKDSVENLKNNGKGMINYLEASLFGMTYGNANQSIIIDGSFFTGHSPSEINLWHISTNGAMKEVEFSANNGSIIIASHNALLGNYVITD